MESPMQPFDWLLAGTPHVPTNQEAHNFHSSKQECALSFQASKMVKEAPNRGQRFVLQQVPDAIGSCMAV
jgi:hypothetical protein